jgi:hypothetical protein
MKFRTATLLACTLLLCLLIKGQSPTDTKVPGVAQAFTGGASVAFRRLPAQAQQIETALDERLTALSNVICHEEIARYAKRGKTTSQLDTLNINVEVMNGIEKYSRIQRRQKMYEDMQKVPGTWSVGEMATLLSSTRDAIALGDTHVTQDDLADYGRSLLTKFTYPAISQRWFLKANSQVHWLPFEGKVWTSPETGEIRRVSWLADDLPANSGVAQVLWTVDFSPVDLSSVIVTLPQKALYQITYKNGADHVDWNVTRFSEYRRYGSDTAIHFDGEDQSAEK